MRKNRQKNKNKLMEKTIVDAVKHAGEHAKFDPDGSYTGYAGGLEKPIQDADDL